MRGVWLEAAERAESKRGSGTRWRGAARDALYRGPFGAVAATPPSEPAETGLPGFIGITQIYPAQAMISTSLSLKQLGEFKSRTGLKSRSDKKKRHRFKSRKRLARLARKLKISRLREE